MPAPPSPAATAAIAAIAADRARRLLGLLDLTLLDPDADEAALDALCARAANRHAAPAALCVLPRQVAGARTRLARYPHLARLPIATVANFPEGSADADRVARDLEAALASGADEVDAVIPWRALEAGDIGHCAALLALMRERCQGVVLKLILETGALSSPERIAQAAQLALDAGADFLKTSTGRAPVNATPEAARILLEAIAERESRYGSRCASRCGFKAAGGIRTPEAAEAYVALTEAVLGRDAVAPARLRIGASALADVLVAQLDAATQGDAR